MKPVFNFSAGPAMLPPKVLAQAQQELLNWNNLGSSVMEISHRSKPFIEVATTAEKDLRTLLSIPDNYKVLFCHGGGRAHFSSVPLNLSAAGDEADHLVSGSWSKGAVKEANKYLRANIVAESEVVDGLVQVPSQDKWQLSDKAKYLHYCPNETVDGVEINWVPQSRVPLVADMSSNILSKPMDVSQFGVIYAGAQKNIGPSGISIVIVRDDLLDQARQDTPSIMHYKTLAEFDSMYNTPPTFAWYLAGLVFKWLIKEGGVEAMAQHNQQKAAHLYQTIDQSEFYNNKVAIENRSKMNVTFQLEDPTLDGLFLKQAEDNGLVALKGHRSVGGMRASIYNAMSMDGVMALTQFMQEFERNNG